MAKIEVNGKDYAVTRKDDNLLFEGSETAYDLLELSDGKYNLIVDNQSYTVEVVGKNTAKGKLTLSINGRRVETTLHNKLAELLKSMGMETGKKKLKDLKAPMPGLVLDVKVSEGQEVYEGQDLVVLEAMKMENAIKSPQDGVIDSIAVKTQDKVEKNQVLVSFQ